MRLQFPSPLRMDVPVLFDLDCRWTGGLRADDSGKATDSGGPAFEFAEPPTCPPPRVRRPSGLLRSALWEHCARLHGNEDKDYEHHNLVVYRGHLVMPWSPDSHRRPYLLKWPAPVLRRSGPRDGRRRCGRRTQSVSCPSDRLRKPKGRALPGLCVHHRPSGNRGLGRHRSGCHRVDCLPGAGRRLLPRRLRTSRAERLLAVPLAVCRCRRQRRPGLGCTRSAKSVEVSASIPASVSPRCTCGDLLFASSAEGRESVLYDVSIPDEPQAIPVGGSPTPSARRRQGAYHATLVGDMALTRKEDGGGFMVFDMSEPTSPPTGPITQRWERRIRLAHDEGFVFVGESTIGRVYDAPRHGRRWPLR